MALFITVRLFSCPWVGTYLILKCCKFAACGMGLRAADPASMKEFVIAVQQRTAELKASLSGSNSGKPVDLGKRVSLQTTTKS